MVYLVSYTLSQHSVLSMVTTMLEKALETIPDGTDLILRLDQGWQYQHKLHFQIFEYWIVSYKTAGLSELLQQPPHQGKAKGLTACIHRQQALSLLKQFLLSNMV